MLGLLSKPGNLKLAQSPLPNPIPMLLMPCLVAGSFGITHFLASAVVSQEIGNLGSFGYRVKWILPFPSLSSVQSSFSLVRRCPGAGHWACLGMGSSGLRETWISHGAGDTEYCSVLLAPQPWQTPAEASCCLLRCVPACFPPQLLLSASTPGR